MDLPFSTNRMTIRFDQMFFAVLHIPSFWGQQYNICKKSDFIEENRHSSVLRFNPFLDLDLHLTISDGPRQTNLVLIAYASSEGSGEPAHPRSLARTSAARSYKQ